MASEHVERKLSAILAGDLKGFTRMVAEDEMAALHMVRDFHLLARDRVKAAHGKMLDDMGDGFMAEFGSVLDAANCAIDLQRRIAHDLNETAGGLPAVAQLGLAVGEVMHYEGHVLGTTVNLAWLLSQFAAPGGVAMLAAAGDQLTGSHGLEIVDLGERVIRGLEKAVRVQCLRTGVEIEDVDAGEPERRLAAILEADVVSWSRLMAMREAETVATITTCREAMIARVRQRRGRVVDSSGDNLLAEFRSALDAVLCGIEIQREHAARNAELPEEARLDFRLGIHLGDVRVDGDRIYGSGVNIAARLEAIAAPGGICISASVHEQVRYHLDVEFADLGEQELKNIPHPVRAYALGGAARAASSAKPPGFFRRLRGLFGPG